MEEKSEIERIYQIYHVELHDPIIFKDFFGKKRKTKEFLLKIYKENKKDIKETPDHPFIDSILKTELKLEEIKKKYLIDSILKTELKLEEIKKKYLIDSIIKVELELELISRRYLSNKEKLIPTFILKKIIKDDDKIDKFLDLKKIIKNDKDQ